MIQQTFKVSAVVPRRTKHEVLTALMEEVGELATEVNITEGYSSKPPGKDGVIGEAVDVIICALDLIWVDSPLMLHTDLEDIVTRIAERKLEKWRTKK